MTGRRTFRDFLYDKNDVIIALLIIVAAMLVIGWCVMRVMDYPNTLDSVATAEEIQSAVENEGGSESPDQPKAQWDGNKLAEDITVTLSSDSTEAAITSLISAGIFDSADEFKYICKKNDVSDADIKTGKFTFKKGTTKSKIAKQVTA